jgi:hypothetical protein
MKSWRSWNNDWSVGVISSEARGACSRPERTTVNVIVNRGYYSMESDDVV